MAKTLPSSTGGRGSIPGWGTKVLHAATKNFLKRNEGALMGTPSSLPRWEPTRHALLQVWPGRCWGQGRTVSALQGDTDLWTVSTQPSRTETMLCRHTTPNHGSQSQAPVSCPKLSTYKLSRKEDKTRPEAQSPPPGLLARRLYLSLPQEGAWPISECMCQPGWA